MRRLTKYILHVIFIVLISTGCTRNDGAIGPWFGQWKLVEFTDGQKPVAEYKGNIFFSFQNSVIQITTIRGEFDEALCWGNWHEEGRTVVIDFDHRDGTTGQDNWNYIPPAVLHFSHGTTVLDVVKRSGSEIILRQSLDGGPQYTYRLKKWG